MKTKLLKRLRQQGRNIIHIYGVTMKNGITTGMRIGVPSNDYVGLFYIGDTPDDVREKAMKIYIEKEIKRLREKRKKCYLLF